ncbi:hypothetical protein EV385_4324 [Krasilnikovia cinnamomea]|uniref:Uncharacterized protein n=1 Tax=Krasilnikovia cinnamomea TaxID=349313 RepID=A0A4Q7ZP26_9ACTN|nr:hypothetical protein [Krasilnikovia cinnamomea]RZU52461.1 hypothetical protein EV385_4324 [Krasilnikovia cinnamomea]
MGVDIDGYIEVRPWASWSDLPNANDWCSAVPLDCLYIDRDYDAFGCLFGVMNYAGFRPVAAGRGLPPDAAEPTRRAFESSSSERQGPTWIGWDEIQRIDWSELTEHADTRLHRYERDADGQWIFRGKSAWSREAFEAQGVPVSPPGAPPNVWPDGSVWTKGDVQFRAGRLTRRQAIPDEGGWRPVWEVMAALARLHGDENCRLVAWFEA